MSWTNCPVCQGLVSAEDAACRICRTPVTTAASAPGSSVAPPSGTWAPPDAGPPGSAAAPPAPTVSPAGWPPPDPSPPPHPGQASSAYPGPAAPPPYPGQPAPVPYPGHAAPAPYAGQPASPYPPAGSPYPPAQPPPGGGPYPGSPYPGSPYAGQAPPAGWGPPPGGPPPGPGTWSMPAGFGPQGWAPPPAPVPPKRSGAVLAIAIGCVVVVLLSGFAVWRVRPTGPDHPDQWDSRVLDAVAFVEQNKGKPFQHPVYVDFLTDEEFRSAVETAPTSVTDEDRAEAEQQEAVLRALGLVEGDIDLLAEQETMTGSGTAAIYDPVTRRVRVRGTELTPDIEGTVVHELTHAWQDQYFDLNRLQDFPTQEQASAFRMIAEGDAVMTENDWIETLTDEQRTAYDELTQAASDQAGDELADVPDVLVASFGAPYEFGQPFLVGLEAVEGPDYLEKAFADPPATDEQIMRPEAYFAGEAAVEVEAPDTEGRDVIEEDSSGALFWYLTLAERIDPLTALRAVDGWGGDQYAVYDRDGTICVASRLVGDSPADTEALGDAVEEWAATLPDVTVDVTADHVDTRACDPGPDADFDHEGRSTTVIAYPVIRLLVWSQGVTEGANRERAVCYSDAFIDQITLDELVGPPLADDRLVALHRGAGTACPG